MTPNDGSLAAVLQQQGFSSAAAAAIDKAVADAGIGGEGGEVVGGGGNGFTKNATTGFAETTVGTETFLALPKDGPNAKANINHRTGTVAQLESLIGGAGEIAVATDDQAIYVYDGVTAGGQRYAPSPLRGLMMLELFWQTNGSNTVDHLLSAGINGQSLTPQLLELDIAGKQVKYLPEAITKDIVVYISGVYTRLATATAGATDDLSLFVKELAADPALSNTLTTYPLLADQPQQFFSFYVTLTAPASLYSFQLGLRRDSATLANISAQLQIFASTAN